LVASSVRCPDLALVSAWPATMAGRRSAGICRDRKRMAPASR
jgi:hypothetical protein